jgi:precorrin-6A/cobalt-precorrin-6A reductase
MNSPQCGEGMNVLLFGGTSETAPAAMALAEAGFAVVVSTATDVPLDIGDHPGISGRQGMLDEEGMEALIHSRDICVIVDVTHPYASAVRRTAQAVGKRLGIPYCSWIRPRSVTADNEVLEAESHEEAAKVAFSGAGPVLLTTGSRNLVPYSEAARASGTRLVVRVLPHPDSYAACRAAGIEQSSIISERGPFSVDENRRAIRKFGIKTIVTKDSGVAGGVPEKLEAARREGCTVIVVKRPEDSSLPTFRALGDLVEQVKELTGQG